MAQGKAAEAIAPFEATIALRPDLTAGYEGLSAACLTVGKLDLAVTPSPAALNSRTTPEPRRCSRNASNWCGSLRRTTGCANWYCARCPSWARPRELDPVCISLVKLNPTVADVHRAGDRGGRRSSRLRMQFFGASGLAALTSRRIPRLPAAMRSRCRYRPRNPC